jgi:hypothetical protein
VRAALGARRELAALFGHGDELMSRSFLVLAGLAATVALAAGACSVTSEPTQFGAGGDDSDGVTADATATTGVTSGAGGQGGAGGGDFDPTTSTGSGNSGPGCNPGPNDDLDKDGWTLSGGDCNDCDPNVNPGAIEVIASGPLDDGGVPEAVDEDCDGSIDNVPQSCDDNIAGNDVNAMNGAKVLELCQVASPNDKKWGVLSAKYTRANGGPAFAPGVQIGVQNLFGPNVHPQGGKAMLALSSGAARTPGQNGSCDAASCSHGSGTAPAGFPQTSANCGGGPATPINDDVALEITLRAPSNATGYSFNFDFFSFEYPEWVCMSYNDQFIALVDPAPQGAINGNISFDSVSNPVSVNAGFFQVCQGCPLGTAQLTGNGFDTWDPEGAGATGWLATQAPVTPKQELTIRFAIWDGQDTAYDSTVLVDNFQWIANGGTVAVGTDPVIPK